MKERERKRKLERNEGKKKEHAWRERKDRKGR
jgi:hypothetical protein